MTSQSLDTLRPDLPPGWPYEAGATDSNAGQRSERSCTP